MHPRHLLLVRQGGRGQVSQYLMSSLGAQPVDFQHAACSVGGCLYPFERFRLAEFSLARKQAHAPSTHAVKRIDTRSRVSC